MGDFFLLYRVYSQWLCHILDGGQSDREPRGAACSNHEQYLYPLFYAKRDRRIFAEKTLQVG